MDDQHFCICSPHMNEGLVWIRRALRHADLKGMLIGPFFDLRHEFLAGALCERVFEGTDGQLDGRPCRNYTLVHEPCNAAQRPECHLHCASPSYHTPPPPTTDLSPGLYSPSP